MSGNTAIQLVRFIALVMVLGAVESAWADNVPVGRRIVMTRVYDNWASVRFDPPYDNDLGCPGNEIARSTYGVIEWGSDASKKAMLATLLAAQAAGGKIGLGISGCWESFGGGVPLIYRVDWDSSP